MADFPVGSRVRITNGRFTGRLGVVTGRVGGVFDSHFVAFDDGEKHVLPRIDLSDGSVKTMWERILDEDQV